MNGRMRGLLIVLGVSGLYAGALVWTYHTETGRIDSCLDDGGRWNQEQHACEGARP